MIDGQKTHLMRTIICKRLHDESRLGFKASTGVWDAGESDLAIDGYRVDLDLSRTGIQDLKTE